jgi:hypothetical protein
MRTNEAWQRTSDVDDVPHDPIGEAVAIALADVLAGASVELSYAPTTSPAPLRPAEPGMAMATGPGPPGWQTTVIVRLNERVARLLDSDHPTSLAELLTGLPAAGVAAAAHFRHHVEEGSQRLNAPLRRALRDTVAAELLTGHLERRTGRPPRADLIDETIQFLIELSGSRVESHELTHGIVIADVLVDDPRLKFRYPRDIRAAKRAPLLFDGQRAVLVVDLEGRARTELQRHRFQRLAPGARVEEAGNDDSLESGSLVAEATAALGGIGFYVRADRSIWTFADGVPLLVRSAEHWTAFPLELAASIEKMIGGGPAAALLARAAFMISAQPGGAILAVVDDPAALDGTVSPKDRYDLRNDIDPTAMRPETRLHHLIDGDELDEHTLVRLATLDGATVLDRNGGLIAYGAIVSSADSEHEGARTAAARTLSETALVVLKVSVDGDITIFRQGRALTTLLGRAHEG